MAEAVRNYCIGNTVKIKGKIQKLTLAAMYRAGMKMTGVKAVMITPEILTEMGFKSVPNASNKVIFYLEGFHLEKTDTDVWKVEYDTTLYLLHVHELQNLLYFTIRKDTLC